ncbi:HNH endonuclease [Tersicoccus sp. Bi-70]|uniref:HNH endonuclease n=1 Tax=Tersicoccus sp. Bi-70 TaxID=1897634 RepID=UPI000978BE7F|nr:HNH endonuclease [Tersicoccus sp. Bi-70]
MFFQVDDQFQVNAKAQHLAREAMMKSIDGLAALGVWTMAGSLCQAKLTDGVVTVEDLVSILLNHDVALALAGKLVAAGLWHAPGHSCDRCDVVPDGAWRFHDWYAMGYDQGAAVKLKRRKAAELKDPAVRAAVWARDAVDAANPTSAHCRYCGTLVKQKDGRSESRPELDHVDPLVVCGPSNIVVACHTCNRAKGNRTPEAAGMTLLPAPRGSSAEPSPRSPLSVAGRQRSSHEPSGAAEKPSPAAEHAGDRTGPDREPPPITPGTTPDHTPDHASGAIPGARTRAAGQGRAGEGSVEVPAGSGKVSPTQPTSSSGRKRRRRRRARGESSQVSEQVVSQEQGPAREPGRAGSAPPVPVDGRFGSPFHGQHRRVDDPDDARCGEHGEHLPCRRCRVDP